MSVTMGAMVGEEVVGEAEGEEIVGEEAVEEVGGNTKYGDAVDGVVRDKEVVGVEVMG